MFTRINARLATRSTAAVVRDQVFAAGPGSFLRRKDFSGSDRAVESELSRLVLDGKLVRVRRGIYYRGKPTRFGMTRPSLLEAAIAVAGPGSGPAGVAAAHLLGFTTQLPGTVEVATPGKVPEPMPGVRFRLRPFGRRERRLTPAEVAVIEVLRDPGAAEASDDDIRVRVRKLVETGMIRASLVADEITEEHHVGARARWRAMELTT